MDLSDIYIGHSIQKQQNTLSSQVLMEHSPNHILGHKSSLGKFKKIEIISSTFSDHNVMRLDINDRKKSVKNTNTWRLNNTQLNNQEIKEEIKKYLETNDNESTMTQNLWDVAKAVLRGKFIAIQSYLKQ